MLHSSSLNKIRNCHEYQIDWFVMKELLAAICIVDAPFNRFEQVITRENKLFSLGSYFKKNGGFIFNKLRIRSLNWNKK